MCLAEQNAKRSSEARHKKLLNLRCIMQDFAQITIDVLSWFILPFIITLVVSWAVSLFRYK